MGPAFSKDRSRNLSHILGRSKPNPALKNSIPRQNLEPFRAVRRNTPLNRGRVRVRFGPRTNANTQTTPKPADGYLPNTHIFGYIVFWCSSNSYLGLVWPL